MGYNGGHKQHTRMNPTQQSIINGVVVEDYEWTIYYHKLLKASKQFKQPETASEDLPCVVCANNLAIAKLLLEKYNTNMLAPMPPVLQPLVMQLSPEAQEFVPEPEPELGPEPEPTGLENEFKTVPGVQAPNPEPEQPGEDVADDVFFGDAPEQRTKKVAYN